MASSSSSTQPHDLTACPQLMSTSSDFTLSHYIEFRRQIKYPLKNLHPRICYKCHVPIIDSLHGTALQRNDHSACYFRDMLAPIAFYIFHTPPARLAATHHFSLPPWVTLTDFVGWLNSAVVLHHYSNLSALFLWFASSYYVQ